MQSTFEISCAKCACKERITVAELKTVEAHVCSICGARINLTAIKKAANAFMEHYGLNYGDTNRE